MVNRNAVNFTIATKLFGLQDGKDFGYIGEHEFYTVDGGDEIDEWLYESGYHNGPLCKNCGYTYCVHCDRPEDNCLVRVPDYFNYVDMNRILDKLSPAMSLVISGENFGKCKVSISSEEKSTIFYSDEDLVIAVVMATYEYLK